MPMLPTLAATLVLTAAVTASSLSDEERIPIPTRAALDDVRELIADSYEIEDADGHADLVALFERLKEAGLGTDSSLPAERYGLLDAAITTAAKAGEARAAHSVALVLVREFDADGVALRSEAAIRASEACTTDEQRAGAVQVLVDVGADAFVANRSKTAKFTFRAVKRMSNDLQGSAGEIADAKYQLFKDARDSRLGEEKGNVSPARAGLDVGTFLCAVAGEWDAGLEHLSAGEKDSPLVPLAKRDAANPQDALAQCQLAEEWADLAERTKAPVLAHAWRSRAHHWFEEAHDELSELRQAAAERALEALEAADEQYAALADPEPEDDVPSAEEEEDRDAVSPKFRKASELLLTAYPIGTTLRENRTRSNGPDTPEYIGTVTLNDGKSLVVEAKGLSGPNRLWKLSLDDSGVLQLDEQVKKNKRDPGGTVSNCASQLKMTRTTIKGSYGWDLKQSKGKQSRVTGKLVWKVLKRAKQAR